MNLWPSKSEPRASLLHQRILCSVPIRICLSMRTSLLYNREFRLQEMWSGTCYSNSSFLAHPSLCFPTESGFSTHIMNKSLCFPVRAT